MSVGDGGLVVGRVFDLRRGEGGVLVQAVILV